MPSPKKKNLKVAGEKDPGLRDVKQIHVQIDRAGWKALQDLAAKLNMSLEAVMVEALNHYLKRHKQAAVVERRIGKAADFPGVKPEEVLPDPISGQFALPLGAPGKAVGRRSRGAP